MQATAIRDWTQTKREQSALLVYSRSSGDASTRNHESRSW